MRRATPGTRWKHLVVGGQLECRSCQDTVARHMFGHVLSSVSCLRTETFQFFFRMPDTLSCHDAIIHSFARGDPQPSRKDVSKVQDTRVCKQRNPVQHHSHLHRRRSRRRLENNPPLHPSCDFLPTLSNLLPSI